MGCWASPFHPVGVNTILAPTPRVSQSLTLDFNIPPRWGEEGYGAGPLTLTLELYAVFDLEKTHAPHRDLARMPDSRPCSGGRPQRRATAAQTIDGRRQAGRRRAFGPCGAIFRRFPRHRAARLDRRRVLRRADVGL